MLKTETYTVSEASKQFGIQINEITRAMRDNRLPKNPRGSEPYVLTIDDLTVAFPTLMAANGASGDSYTTFSASRKFMVEEWKILKAIQDGILPAEKVNGSDVFTHDDFLSVFFPSEQVDIFEESVADMVPVQVDSEFLSNVSQFPDGFWSLGAVARYYDISEDVARKLVMDNKIHANIHGSTMMVEFDSFSRVYDSISKTGEYLSIEDISRRYDITVHEIYRTVNSGKLAPHQIGARTKFSLNEFNELFPLVKERSSEIIYTASPIPLIVISRHWVISTTQLREMHRRGMIECNKIYGVSTLMLSDVIKHYPKLTRREHSNAVLMDVAMPDGFMYAGVRYHQSKVAGGVAPDVKVVKKPVAKKSVNVASPTVSQEFDQSFNLNRLIDNNRELKSKLQARELVIEMLSKELVEIKASIDNQVGDLKEIEELVEIVKDVPAVKKKWWKLF